MNEQHNNVLHIIHPSSSSSATLRLFKVFSVYFLSPGVEFIVCSKYWNRLWIRRERAILWPCPYWNAYTRSQCEHPMAWMLPTTKCTLCICAISCITNSQTENIRLQSYSSSTRVLLNGEDEHRMWWVWVCFPFIRNRIVLPMSSYGRMEMHRASHSTEEQQQQQRRWWWQHRQSTQQFHSSELNRCELQNTTSCLATVRHSLLTGSGLVIRIKFLTSIWQWHNYSSTFSLKQIFAQFIHMPRTWCTVYAHPQCSTTSEFYIHDTRHSIKTVQREIVECLCGWQKRKHENVFIHYSATGDAIRNDTTELLCPNEECRGEVDHLKRWERISHFVN